jgi:DNA (cytosine-5)-methyltransferase 1
MSTQYMRRPGGKPMLLDLFCGAGGASVGYHRAGFDVVGVDNRPQPHYPFEFHQADATEYPLDGFDAIHASPPCQLFSVATHGDSERGEKYGDLLSPTRVRLRAQSRPWVIENVPGAPMRPDFKLCGCLFGLPMLRRERWFETSWYGFALRSPCNHPEPSLSVTGHGVGVGNGQRGRIAAILGRNPGIADAKAAMGIDWMNRDELSQAIPPAYTEYIGHQLIDAL